MGPWTALLLTCLLLVVAPEGINTGAAAGGNGGGTGDGAGEGTIDAGGNGGGANDNSIDTGGNGVGTGGGDTIDAGGNGVGTGGDTTGAGGTDADTRKRRKFLKGLKTGIPIVDDVIGFVSSVLGIVDFIKGNKEPDTYGAMLKQFDEMSEKLNFLEQELRAINLRTLSHLEQKIDKQMEWQNSIQTLEDLLRIVDSTYDAFYSRLERKASFEDFTLTTFATEAVRFGPGSLLATMNSLRNVALGTSHPKSWSGGLHRGKRFAFKDGLFRQLVTRHEVSEKLVCGLDHSPRQQGYNILRILLLSLVKIDVMVKFSYTTLQTMHNETNAAEMEAHTEHYLEVVEAVTKGAVQELERLSNTFWRCDRRSHRRGSTYDEVTNFLQLHIENEVDLSSSSRRPCDGKCSRFNSGRAKKCSDNRYSHRRRLIQRRRGHAMPCKYQRPCKGKLYQCRDMNRDATACLSSDKTRRYGWIKYSDGTKLGSHNSCSRKEEVKDWRGKRRSTCSFCSCLCDDATGSDRYFSLLPAVSDISRNKAVTGVRLVKKKGVFYIEVQQAAADKLGHDNSSTAQWKYISVNRYSSRSQYRLSYYQRTVQLEDLTAPSGHVITGVSFVTVGGRLGLRIQVTRISAKGVLLRRSSRWMSASSRSCRQLSVSRELPRRSGITSWPDSPSRQCKLLKFQPSSERSDAAQSTVPWLDVQPVAPRPAGLLSGVGIYHKGHQSSGGFIGLRVHQAFKIRQN